MHPQLRLQTNATKTTRYAAKTGQMVLNNIKETYLGFSAVPISRACSMVYNTFITTHVETSNVVASEI